MDGSIKESCILSKLIRFRTSWDNVTVAQKTVENLIERLRLEDKRPNDATKSQERNTQNALVVNHLGKQGRSSLHKYDKLPVTSVERKDTSSGKAGANQIYSILYEDVPLRYLWKNFGIENAEHL